MNTSQSPGVFDTIKMHVGKLAEDAKKAFNPPPVVGSDKGGAKAFDTEVDARGGGYTATGGRLRRKSRRGSKKVRKTRRRKSRR